MRQFADLCEAAAATTKKLEKMKLVGEYLRSLPVEDAARAALFLTGRPFPRFTEHTTQVGGNLIWQALSLVSGASPEAMAAAYRRHGDLGGAAQDVLAGRSGSDTDTFTLAGAETAFRELMTRRGPAQKIDLLVQVLRKLTPVEAKYFVKILAGELRIGLNDGLLEEALARAYQRPLSEIQRANMLTGDIGETLRLAAGGNLLQTRLRIFHPVGFMLASAAETTQELVETFPSGAMVQDKYDGIRAQAHKDGTSVKLFSRTLDEIGEFPELISPLLALPGGFILDGEIIGWRNGRPIPFTELQRRLGRKHADLFLPLELPVSFIVFDLIWQNGELLFDLPWSERRERLQHLLQEAQAPLVRLSDSLLASTHDDFERAFQGALDRGHEGIMAKSPNSPYVPGRRGRYWLKLKRPMATLDVVITAVEYGHGKRHHVLSDYTFSVRDGDRLVNVGKAYTGLTDKEIAELTEYFREHTLLDEGFRRSVEPTVVIEVAFNNIQRSTRHASGYALRFPRIVRLRPDKPAAEIDTLQRVRELYEAQNLQPGA